MFWAYATRRCRSGFTENSLRRQTNDTFGWHSAFVGFACPTEKTQMIFVSDAEPQHMCLIPNFFFSTLDKHN